MAITSTEKKRRFILFSLLGLAAAVVIVLASFLLFTPEKPSGTSKMASARTEAVSGQAGGVGSEEYNQKLKEACRTLGEYAIYTDKIRAYTEEMELSEAVDRAMDECIREDVLREFLMKHRAEARAMSIFEYDQERHMQQEREAGIEKGKEQLLHMQVQKNLARGMSISEIAEVLDETEKRIREIASADSGEQEE